MVDSEKKKIKITVKTKKKSIFAESDELEQRLEAAKKRVAVDRENCLTADNTTDELVYMLLTKSMREMFQKVDKEQNGNFVLGSMQRLSSKMWKGLIK